MKRLALEIMVIGLLTGLCGLTANALHPEGVVLARNYFKLGGVKLPLPTPPEVNEVNQPTVSPPVVVTPVPLPPEPNEVIIESVPEPNVVSETVPQPDPVETEVGPQDDCIKQDENGLMLACYDFVSGIWTAMHGGDNTVVFVDARTQTEYEEGHIQGGVLLDHYRRDQYLPDLLPRLQSAAFIVVYCDGGCEASRYLATSLIYEHQIPAQSVYIYEGGVDEWQEKGHELVKGAQP